MRNTLIAACLACAAAPAMAGTSVNGYIRSDGTVVAPHYRSSPNGVQYDNYSAKGNSNPYTGQRGSGPSEMYPSNSYQPRAVTPSYPAANPYSGNPYGSGRR